MRRPLSDKRRALRRFLFAMPSSRRLFFLPAALALVLCAGTWWLWPEGLALWRRIMVLSLSVALGFHLAAALKVRGVAAARTWLECVAFLLVMGAALHLPSAFGWLLLLIGWFWRFLVRNLWK